MKAILERAEALKIVFELGFELKDENFIELNCVQYQSLKAQGYDINKHWYGISRGIFEERNNPPKELPIVDEHEMLRIKKAILWIYEISDRANRPFYSFTERLDYLRNILPPAIVDEENDETR